MLLWTVRPRRPASVPSFDATRLQERRPFGPLPVNTTPRAGLRGELKELAPVLEQKAADAEVMLKQVAVDQAEVRPVSLRRDAAVRAPSRVATRLDIEKETTPGILRWRRVASMA